MPFHIRDPETDRLARELAAIQGDGITRAVKSALETKLREERQKIPLLERIKDITDKLNTNPDSSFTPDKAFYDWLAGEEGE